MDSTPHTKSYSTGKLVLHSPCTVGAEAFTPVGDRNKFCSQCSKVVHNLVGKSEAEIKALFEANGGQLCGSIVVRKPRPVSVIRLHQPISKPNYFKHLAATASLLLLTQFSSASTPKAKAGIESIVPIVGEPTGRPFSKNAKLPSQNTLISGVILNQDSSEMGVDVEIRIYSKQVLVAKTMSQNGLFKIDLEGKVKPEDVVGLVIGANTAVFAETNEKAIHHASRRTMRLRDAQNVSLVVEFEIMFDEIQVDGGIGWEPDIEVEPEPIIEPPVPEIIEPDPIIGPVMPKLNDDL